MLSQGSWEVYTKSVCLDGTSKRTVPHEERVFLELWLLAFPHWWGKCCLWTVRLCSRLQTACFSNLQTFPLLETVLWRITHQKWDKPKKYIERGGHREEHFRDAERLQTWHTAIWQDPAKQSLARAHVDQMSLVCVCVHGRGARLSTVKYLKYTTSIINKNKVLGG